MKRNSLLFLLLTLFSFSTKSQFIINGPAIGGVTPTGARMYLCTEQPQTINILLSEDGNENNTKSFQAFTTKEKFNTTIVDLSDLKTDTKYFYSFLIGEKKDSIQGSFTTFPVNGKRGNYTFVTGSCQETENMKVFDVIPKHNPRFMLHTGDFTYPDYQIAPDYSADYAKVAYSYRKRYDEKVMKEMLYSIPIDYIYDDNDYVGGNGGRYNKNGFRSNFKGTVDHMFIIDSFPPSWRRNVIKGYTEFFPGYEMVDTSEGIYHSFKFANAEFFFVDRCSAHEDPLAANFTYDAKKNTWSFSPKDSVTLFGAKQMQWLKNGLKNSTADWKFIVSGAPFNKALRKLIDKGMKIQKIQAKGYNGFHMATGFASYFAGYPKEQEDFLNFIKQENIKDVIVISGDTHHNVMDDGANAGLPEMNASGLSVTGTYLAYFLNLVGNGTMMYDIGDEIWNQGGNGIGNLNFKNAFGRVDIVENNYITLSLIDEDNEVISSFRVYHSDYAGERK